MYQVETKSFLSCLSSSDEMTRRIELYDWGQTCLGEIHRWPQSLQNAVVLMLSSGVPMQIAWGEEHIQLYNDAYIPLLGHGTLHPWSLGKSAKLSWPEVWPEIAPLWSRVKESGEPFVGNDIRFLLKRNGDVEETFFNLSIAPLRNDDLRVEGVLVTAFETTERVRKESKIQNDLMVRDEFMSIASHDLKSPLTALKLLTQTQKQLVLRQDTRGFDKERIRHFSETVDEQVGRLNRMVDDMLEIGRVRRGKLVLNREEVELGRLVRDSIESMRTHFTAKNFPHIRTHKIVKGFWDPEKIKQVVVNILLSAIRFGNSGPLELNVDVDGNYALLTLVDKAIDIPLDRLEKIFDRYERLGPKEKTAFDHGLFLTKNIVEAHEGKIWIESRPMKGSTFYVLLPGPVSVPGQSRGQ